MILRNAVFILSFLLCLPFAKAMDPSEEKNATSTLTVTALKDEEEDLQMVTVYMWEDQNRIKGHVAVQTPKHYMSFRPYSEVWGKNKTDKAGRPFGYAPLDVKLDQRLQDNKLKASWPCKTLTLAMDAQSMDATWERWFGNHFSFSFRDTKLTIDSVGYQLLKIRYIDKRLQHLAKYKRLCYDYLKDNLPYFTNTSIAYILLFEKGLSREGICDLEHPKYFEDELLWDVPVTIANFMNARSIDKNTLTAFNPSIADINLTLQEAIRHRELIKIHKKLEGYKVESLVPEHKEAILTIMNVEEPIEEKRQKVDDYLESWFSPGSLLNEFYYET